MVLLIILNIILIILLLFLILFFVRNNKSEQKNICANNNEHCVNKIDKSENHKQKNISNLKKVFVGRFVTDEEYLQMEKNRKSDISIILEDINREYEHLKELNK